MMRVGMAKRDEIIVAIAILLTSYAAAMDRSLRDTREQMGDIELVYASESEMVTRLYPTNTY